MSYKISDNYSSAYFNKEKILLVTIAIGEKYINEYNKLFRPSQELYAKRNGYDFKVVTNFLDDKYKFHKSISFNKILVCSQEWSQDYDFIIFIDADIVINKDSPPIHNFVNYGDKIGIINEFSQPSFEKRLQINHKYGLEKNPKAYYK